MTYKQKEGLKLAALTTPILVIISIVLNYFFPEVFGWKFFLTIGSIVTLVAAYFVSKKNFMKLLFFFGYHLLIFGTVLWISWTYISPAFTTEWITGFNWLRHFLILVGQVTLLLIFTHSILSCFSSKKLKETDFGQWSISGWMPEWGNNEKNSWFGLFLGLPEWMVKVQAILAVSTVIKETKQIQVKKYGSTAAERFAADCRFTLQYKVDCTHKHIMRPNGDEDLVNLVIAKLTEWLNDPTHEYKNIEDLKKDKKKIEEDYLVPVLKDDSREMYGDEIINFKLIDIEAPPEQIRQQIQDAAAKAAQIAVDEREKINQANAIALAKQLMEDSKDDQGKPTITFTQALAEGRLQLGITKSSEAKIKGGSALNIFPT